VDRRGYDLLVDHPRFPERSGGAVRSATRGAELVGELARYEDSYRLCYVRGPEGIVVELAEHIG